MANYWKTTIVNKSNKTERHVLTTRIFNKICPKIIRKPPRDLAIPSSTSP
jgi:hypothetical protein